MNGAGLPENKRREWLTPTAAYLIAVSMFFLRRINFFNMVFYYLGADSIKTVLSTGLYCLMDLYLGLYFLKVISKRFNGWAAASMALVAVLYGLPYLIHGRYVALVQYVIFFVPFLLIAYLCIFDEDGLRRFFRAFEQFSWFAAVMGTAYVVLLFAVADESSGVINIVGMNYGDIAYALIPCYIYSLIVMLRRTTWKDILRLAVLFVAIVYTGTRSALLIMFFAALLYVVLCLVMRGIQRKFLLKSIALAVSMVVVFGVCSKVVPGSSRLTATQGGVYEIEEQHEVQTDTSNDVFNVDTQTYQTINLAYIHYIVNSDTTRLETEKMLHDDIVNRTGKYIIVRDDQVQKLADFSLHMNRIVLWDSAYQEFLKAPVFGNGCMYFQMKYDYFPHNIVLELLCDFGVVGTLIAVALLLWGTIRALIYIRRSCRQQAEDKVYGFLPVLVLGISYAPMHLLYTGLYANSMLLFLGMILIFMNLYFSKHAECRELSFKK